VLAAPSCELCAGALNGSSLLLTSYMIANDHFQRYNSAVFQSLASNDYAVAVVTPAFLNGGRWNITAAEALGLLLGDGYTSWGANLTLGYGPSAGWTIPGLLRTPFELCSKMLPQLAYT
jgi:hypothetical protein